MNILIIEHASGRAENIIKIFKKIRARIIVWKPYKTVRPAGKFNGIILTGGPMSAKELIESSNQSFQEEIQFIKQNIKMGTPILGICLGHQLLTELLDGRLIYGGKWQRGWLSQHLTPEGTTDPLFRNCPQSFITFEYHQDKVIKLPPKTILLITSKHCPIDGFRIKNKPIWGIQIHPEITPQKAKKIFLDKKSQLLHKGMNVDREIKKGYRYHSAQLGKQIFENFVKQIS